MYPSRLVERGACRTRPSCAAANKTKKLRGVERGDTRQALRTRQAVANHSRDIVRPGLRRLDCGSHWLRRGESLRPTGFAESQARPQPPTAAVTWARGRPTSARRRERQRGAADPLAMGFVVIRVRGRSGLGAVMSCVAANELLPQRGPLFRAAPAPFRLAFGVQVLGGERHGKKLATTIRLVRTQVTCLANPLHFY